MNWNLSRLFLACVVGFLFCLVVVFCVLFVGAFCCFGVLLFFVLCFCVVIVTVHRTTYRSFTSSLLRPLNRRWSTYAIINQLIPYCNMELNMLNDLAKAMKALDGKKPIAGEIQAELNSHTAGVSDIHAWRLMLPSSSRVSPVTYHSVAVRYPDLCKFMHSRWELGSLPLEESVENSLDTSSSGTPMPKLMALLRRIWRRSYHKCSPKSPTTQALRMGFS